MHELLGSLRHDPLFVALDRRSSMDLASRFMVAGHPDPHVNTFCGVPLLVSSPGPVRGAAVLMKNGQIRFNVDKEPSYD
jgi:hypothetical protein